MNKQRIIFASLGIAGVISTLFPWIDAPFISLPGTTSIYGTIVLFSSIITIVLSFMGDKLEPIINTNYFMILGGISGGASLLQIIFSMGSGANSLLGSVGIGIGLILSLLIGIATALTPKFIDKFL